MGRSIGLPEWLTTGIYNVVNVTNDEFVLLASTEDYASALLSDVEHLIDHCFEHLQEIACFYNDTRVRSEAWAVVTIYYFAFFCAQAFLRLTGQPVIFVKKDIARNLKRMANAARAPGAGAFTMEKIQDVSATHAEYRLLKSNESKVHDATWKKSLNYLYDLVHDPSIAASMAEASLYGNLTARHLFGVYDSNYAWPSEVRTRANYLPGFAYKHLQNDSITKIGSVISNWKHANEWSDVQRLLSFSVASCATGSSAEFDTHVNLMHDVAQCLFLLTRELYSELLERKGIDQRWEDNRRRFRASMDLQPGDFPYIARTYR